MIVDGTHYNKNCSCRDCDMVTNLQNNNSKNNMKAKLEELRNFIEYEVFTTELVGASTNKILNKVNELFNDNVIQKERAYDDEKEYWYVSEYNNVLSNTADNDVVDKGLFEAGNFFDTKEEAEMEALRIKGMRVKQTAKEGNMFYYWCFKFDRVDRGRFGFDFFMDKKFATEKEAQDWGDEVGKAFEDNNK